MKVSNLINNNGNPAPNQFVITNNGGNLIYFQSYDSVIARYDKNSQKLYISELWNYAKTTSKHFYIFIEDYTCYRGNRKSVLENIANGTFAVVDEKFLAY